MIEYNYIIEYIKHINKMKNAMIVFCKNNIIQVKVFSKMCNILIYILYKYE